ncbi:hypothetical protein SDC9_161388 [bioreactor metagenome]|uniref:Uncharacterized protein n=1 Tax=bioreactor metagenome TaxID=1076179 RepID=A0A645FKH2_9ZZZZ
MEAAGEKVRDRDGVHGDAVAAQTLGDDEPVEIGSDSKADRRPARAGKPAPVGEAGQTHQEPAGHVGSLRTERGNPRAECTPAEEIGFGVLVRAFGEDDADGDDDRHVGHDGNQMLNLVC